MLWWDVSTNYLYYGILDKQGTYLLNFIQVSTVFSPRLCLPIPLGLTAEDAPSICGRICAMAMLICIVFTSVTDYRTFVFYTYVFMVFLTAVSSGYELQMGDHIN